MSTCGWPASGCRTDPIRMCAWTSESTLISPELCSIVVYVRAYSSTACLPLPQPVVGGVSIEKV